MRLALRWTPFKDLRFRVCRRYDLFSLFTYFPTTRVHIVRVSVARNQVQSRELQTSHMNQRSPCQSHGHVLARPICKDDSFQAQLLACRDQVWWDARDGQDILHGHEERQDDKPEPPRRSLSIREIRERMNSDQRSMQSKESIGEFEPGLRLLDNGYGTWEDMEMFID